MLLCMFLIVICVAVGLAWYVFSETFRNILKIGVVLLIAATLMVWGIGRRLDRAAHPQAQQSAR
jgi:drug/metabolite transporter (DMT)-like permease